MKKLSAAIASTFVFFTLTATAFADSVKICPKDGVFFKLCDLSATKFTDIVGAIISLLLILAVVVAIIFLVWGGIKWILSGGDKTAVESARNHIVAALVGLVIALAAYFLLRIVLGFFGVNVVEFTLPTFL